MSFCLCDDWGNSLMVYCLCILHTLDSTYRLHFPYAANLSSFSIESDLRTCRDCCCEVSLHTTETSPITQKSQRTRGIP